MLYEILIILLNKDLHTHLLPFLLQFDNPIQTLLTNIITPLTSRWKLDVQNMFYILIGIMRALDEINKFNIFFEWFYPNTMKLFQNMLNMCPEEVKIHKALLKFMKELTNNATHRLKLDNVNGFIIFKECCPLITTIINMQKPFFATLADSSAAAIYQERVAELYKFLKYELVILTNIIRGGYVQFGILPIYNDNSFAVISKLLFEQILSFDIKELHKYKSVENAVYQYTGAFLKTHSDLYFDYEDIKLKIGILTLLKLGLETENYSLRTLCSYSLKSIIKFILDERFKARTRMDVQEKIHKLLNSALSLFLNITEIAFKTACYEEVENIYALSELVFLLIALDKGLFDNTREIILAGERLVRTRERMDEELQRLFEGVNLTSQATDLEKFTKNFIAFRSNIKGIV